MGTTLSRPCLACGSPEVLSVVVFSSDSSVTFTICHRCDDRRWTHDDREVPLGSLLPLFRRRWADGRVKTA